LYCIQHRLSRWQWDCCRNRNECADYIQFVELAEQLSDFQLLLKDCPSRCGFHRPQNLQWNPLPLPFSTFQIIVTVRHFHFSRPRFFCRTWCNIVWLEITDVSKAALHVRLRRTLILLLFDVPRGEFPKRSVLPWSWGLQVPRVPSQRHAHTLVRNIFRAHLGLLNIFY
jgi:hypothetical protein